MERWQTLERFPGYEVSNRGRVRRDGRVLPVSRNPGRRAQVVHVWDGRGRLIHTTVPRLVWMGFRGELRPDERVYLLDTRRAAAPHNLRKMRLEKKSA